MIFYSTLGGKVLQLSDYSIFTWTVAQSQLKILVSWEKHFKHCEKWKKKKLLKAIRYVDWKFPLRITSHVVIVLFRITDIAGAVLD